MQPTESTRRPRRAPSLSAIFAAPNGTVAGTSAARNGWLNVMLPRPLHFLTLIVYRPRGALSSSDDQGRSDDGK